MATFDERARDWDTPDRVQRADEVAAAIDAAVPIDRSIRAIEIGAGTGLLGLHFADRLQSLLLTDPSAGMLEVADETIRRGGLRNVTTRRFDLTADSPPAGPFDLLLSLLVLHHIEDTAGAFRAAWALLAPGGRLAMADLDTEDGSFHSAEAEGIHHLGFDRGELANLAREAGFVDVAFSTATTIEEDGRRYPLFLLTARRP
jgi:2-polyprenyl-3-methyl-5-hydroxy-6-metoxy-1,4-benzoquinol methylase